MLARLPSLLTRQSLGPRLARDVSHVRAHRLVERRLASTVATDLSTPSTTRRVLRFAGKSLKILFGVSAFAAGTTFAYQTWQDRTFPSRVNRVLKIYTAFAPIYVDYQLATWRVPESQGKEALDKEYERLHEKHAPRIADLVLELRGTWIKLAQAVASRPELAPEAYRNALSFLMDSVPPLEFKELEPGVKAAFGVDDLLEIFETVDPNCLGAASVSQVHAATLKEPIIVYDGPNGTHPREIRDVVVKIRYPDAPQNFTLDLLTMRQLMTLARPQLLPAQREVEKMILRELNFLEEAQSLENIGNAVRNSSRFPGVLIPHPVPGMCNEGAIVMERMEGGKLETRVKRHYEELAKGMGTTVEELQQRMMTRFFGGRGPSSSSSSPSSGDLKEKSSPPVQITEQMDRQGILGLISSVMDVLGGPMAVVRLSYAYLKLIWYESVGWWLRPALTNTIATIGLAKRVEYPERPLPVRTGSLYDKILKVHGYEILEFGWSNADPHPGNIFLTPSGEVALLDYGATFRLPDAQRLALARLILQLNEKEPDSQAIAKEMLSLGFSFPPDYDGEKLLNSIATGLFTARGFSGRNRGHGTNNGGERPKLESVPDRFFLIARTVGLLRGLGFALGLGRVDVAQAWAESARRALETREVWSG